MNIQNIIDNFSNSNELKQARLIDEKTSFFVEKSMTGNKYAEQFKQTSKKIINNTDGYNRFVSNFTFPLKSTQIATKISQQFQKIFNAEDRNFYYSDNKYQGSFNLNVYKSFIYPIYLRTPNSLVYLTIDGNSIDFKEIRSNEILAFEQKDDNYFEWIIIERQNSIIYIDETIFQVFEYKKNTIGKLISETPNILGFVPVFHVSNEILNSNSNFVRSNIFTTSLAEFEEYERLAIFKKIMSPYSFFLFVTRFREPNCNYDTGEVHCENGFLVSNEDGKSLYTFINGDAVPTKCPACNQDLGIGNQIAMGKLFDGDSWDALEKPLNFIAPPTDILKYSDEFIQTKEKELYNSILGIEQNLNEKVANTAQAYQYNTLSREQVLLNLKSNFENLINTIENSVLFAFGQEKITFNIDLGSKFLISSLESLMSDLEKAEQLGLDEVLSIRRQVIAKKYENDPLGKMRADILNAFYPDIPTTELAKLDISNRLKKKQIYFHSYISWFENTKRPITDFQDVKSALNQLEKYFETFLKENNVIN